MPRKSPPPPPLCDGWNTAHEECCPDSFSPLLGAPFLGPHRQPETPETQDSGVKMGRVNETQAADLGNPQWSGQQVFWRRASGARAILSPMKKWRLTKNLRLPQVLNGSHFMFERGCSCRTSGSGKVPLSRRPLISALGMGFVTGGGGVGHPASMPGNISSKSWAGGIGFTIPQCLLLNHLVFGCKRDECNFGQGGRGLVISSRKAPIHPDEQPPKMCQPFPFVQRF